MPRLSTLKPQHLEVCDNTLKSRGMIAPNRAIIAAIVIANPTLVRLLITGYSGEITRKAKCPTLDTYEREYLLDAVANQYAGSPWPYNCDSEEVVFAFRDRLVENASQAGWVFHS
jgi:hypothetical protein